MRCDWKTSPKKTDDLSNIKDQENIGMGTFSNRMLGTLKNEPVLSNSTRNNS
ncbi:hypothetical protein [Flagellimonas sp.]|jgi:hypothetical protein|uniref:hypothetical protein n=1 Tax=Flagellimonas sp. TaxID=2058762 RepID=UPI003BABFF3C